MDYRLDLKTMVAVGGGCELDEPLVRRFKNFSVKVGEGERSDKVLMVAFVMVVGSI